MGGGDGWQRQRGDPALMTGAADVGQKVVVEGGIAVPEAERAVAKRVVEVRPHFQRAEPRVHAEDFGIEAEALEVTSEIEGGAAFPRADFQDAGRAEFFDELAEGWRVGSPAGGIIGPCRGVEVLIGIGAVKQRPDPPVKSPETAVASLADRRRFKLKPRR